MLGMIVNLLIYATGAWDGLIWYVQCAVELRVALEFGSKRQHPG